MSLLTTLIRYIKPFYRLIQKSLFFSLKNRLFIFDLLFLNRNSVLNGTVLDRLEVLFNFLGGLLCKE